MLNQDRLEDRLILQRLKGRYGSGQQHFFELSFQSCKERKDYAKDYSATLCDFRALAKKSTLMSNSITEPHILNAIVNELTEEQNKNFHEYVVFIIFLG